MAETHSNTDRNMRQWDFTRLRDCMEYLDSEYAELRRAARAWRVSDDHLHEAVLRFATSFDRLNTPFADGLSLRLYVLRIARNIDYDERRTAKRRPETELPVWTENSLSLSETPDSHEGLPMGGFMFEVETHVRSHPVAADRACFELVVMNEMSMEQAAAELGCGKSTVSRGLRRVLESLGRRFGVPPEKLRENIKYIRWKQSSPS